MATCQKKSFCYTSLHSHTINKLYYSRWKSIINSPSRHQKAMYRNFLDWIKFPGAEYDRIQIEDMVFQRFIQCLIWKTEIWGRVCAVPYGDLNLDIIIIIILWKYKPSTWGYILIIGLYPDQYLFLTGLVQPREKKVSTVLSNHGKTNTGHWQFLIAPPINLISYAPVNITGFLCSQ